MTWATMVGVDGGRRLATMWVMMWVMMWLMGTMVAMMPATMAVTTPAKGMAGTPAGGGGAPGGGRGGSGGGSGSGGGDGGGSGGCILQGLLLLIVKIFLYGIFMIMMCGGNRRGHTSPHTLVTLEVYRHTFGCGMLIPKIS
jgi:hypothetical protein